MLTIADFDITLNVFPHFDQRFLVLISNPANSAAMNRVSPTLGRPLFASMTLVLRVER